MKVLSFVSSCRADGNTSRAAALMEEALKGEAEKRKITLEIERISLSRLDIRPCRGCRLCFDKGEDTCPLKDDVLSLRDQMLKADGYLFSSPVYVEDVNGIMKSFIDRMAYLCHRPELSGKTAFLMTTSGMGSSNHALRTMGTALSAWGCRVQGRMKIAAGALLDKDEMRARYKKDILKAAESFFCDLLRGVEGKPSWYSLIAFHVQKRCWEKKEYQEKNPYDYAYWKEKGWLNSKSVYYVPLNRGKWRIQMARLLAKAVTRFLLS